MLSFVKVNVITSVCLPLQSTNDVKP